MTDPLIDPATGTPLARLFAIAYRALVDGLHARLAERAGPTCGRTSAVLLAVDGGLRSVEIAVLLGVTKQAASKLVDTMQAAGYVAEPDPRDERAKRVADPARPRAARGGRRTYAELESAWADVLGADRVDALRADLTRVLEPPRRQAARRHAALTGHTANRPSILRGGEAA
jgi:DNA-binding MarR family transcriptional regulator